MEYLWLQGIENSQMSSSIGRTVYYVINQGSQGAALGLADSEAVSQGPRLLPASRCAVFFPLVRFPAIPPDLCRKVPQLQVPQPQATEPRSRKTRKTCLSSCCFFIRLRIPFPEAPVDFFSRVTSANLHPMLVPRPAAGKRNGLVVIDQWFSFFF